MRKNIFLKGMEKNTERALDKLTRGLIRSLKGGGGKESVQKQKMYLKLNVFDLLFINF